MASISFSASNISFLLIANIGLNAQAIFKEKEMDLEAQEKEIIHF